jgi:hypothetical protein
MVSLALSNAGDEIDHFYTKRVNEGEYLSEAGKEFIRAEEDKGGSRNA